MSPQQQKSGSSGLIAAGALAAAGAGAWYYHKDMTKEELREAGEGYLAKTKEVTAIAAEKTSEASKALYAKIMAILYPEGEQEVDGTTFEEPSQEAGEAQTEVQEDVVSEAEEETLEADEEL